MGEGHGINAYHPKPGLEADNVSSTDTDKYNIIHYLALSSLHSKAEMSMSGCGVQTRLPALWL